MVGRVWVVRGLGGARRERTWGTGLFEWEGQGFVIDGLPTWCFERFDEDAGRWDSLTEEFETSAELFDLPFFDGRTLRDVFGECRFFVES